MSIESFFNSSPEQERERADTARKLQKSQENLEGGVRNEDNQNRPLKEAREILSEAEVQGRALNDDERTRLRSVLEKIGSPLQYEDVPKAEKDDSDEETPPYLKKVV